MNSKFFTNEDSNTLEYQRLVPAVAKLPKKNQRYSGITGKSLFDRIKERTKLNKDIKILIVIDDGDCKIKSSKRYNLMS